MYLHRSNRLDRLADELAELVRSPGLSPFEPELIVVPGRALERWLSLALAARLGIWTNARFPFPRRFLEEGLTAVLDRKIDPEAYSPERLVWATAALLPELLERAPFEPLRRYLAGPHPERRRHELASRIAHTFDRYPIFRPDLVLAWERGEGDDWQAILWRALNERLGSGHLARAAQELSQALRERSPGRGALPARVSVFDTGTLPPLFLELYAALGQFSEVHLFVLSPSREHWADIHPRRQISRALKKRGKAEETAQLALGFAEGNPLLASLGRVGRDAHFILESRIDYLENERDLYVCPEEDEGLRHALAVVQADILHLRHRSPESIEHLPLPLDPEDRSIAIHACHTPMREVEVLRDQILALFQDMPSLEPRDVLVMTPDLETYAPLFEAVFDIDPKDPTHLPFRITGLPLSAKSPCIEAFFAILKTLSGRVTAADLLELIARDPIRRRFEIEESELDTLRSFIIDARVRWGIDADHRSRFEQPPFPETTWRFGLERLLLGYAMPAEDHALFHDILPLGAIEGDTAELAGRFADFCETFFSIHRLLSEEHTVGRFRMILLDTMARLLLEPEDQSDSLQPLREALTAMSEHAAAANFTEKLPLDVVRSRLVDMIENAPIPALGVLTGGICFSSFSALRGLSARVVCLVGLNHGAFPRALAAPSFDRITAEPRRGDRNPRDDDRYLFLQALLAARSKLVITYTGQSSEGNTDLPPSVLVGELLDAIDASFNASFLAERPPREQILVRHPMQPFSPRAFQSDLDGRIQSFDTRFCEGARALVSPRRKADSFFRRPLPPPEEIGTGISVDELISFFSNPMRALVRDRLGLTLEEDREALESREPTRLMGLDEHTLGTDLLKRALAGHDLDEAYPVLRASGALPLGVVGRCRYELALPEIEEMAKAIRRLCHGPRLEPLPLDLSIGDARIFGVLRDLWPHAQIIYRFASVRARGELALWIRHLALQCASDAKAPRQSKLVGRDKAKGRASVVTFGPVENAAALLAELVAIHRLGQNEPLAFFPESSYAYAKAKKRGRSDDEARTDALHAFTPSHAIAAQWSESSDPYIQRVLAGRDPTDPALALVEGSKMRFSDLALSVFEPLLAHREEGDRAET